VAGTERLAQLPERTIRHARHRGDEHVVRQFVWTKTHRQRVELEKGRGL